MSNYNDTPCSVMRRPEVCRATGLSYSTIHRKEAADGFPKRRRLGPNSVGWLRTEVEAWIRDRAVVDAGEVPGV